jgi:hypothetical protein
MLIHFRKNTALPILVVFPVRQAFLKIYRSRKYAKKSFSRYQEGNQKPQCEKGQTRHRSEDKGQTSIL